MQAVETITEPRTQNSSNVNVTVTLEVAVYIVLLLLIMAIRLVSLGDPPLGHAEARQALSAWRVVSPEASGADIIADSPLMFALQSISFSIFGASEFSARIMGALVGIAFTLSPLLFRSILGSVRTFVLCLLLAFSPVVMMTARESDGTLLAAFFAVLTLWSAWRYWQSARPVYAQFGIVTFAGLIFLSEPAGFMLALTLVIAGAAAAWWSVGDVELSTGERLPVRERLSAVPWLTGLGVAAAVVALIATGFMLYPQGLGMVGQAIGNGLSGILVSQPETPRAFPLLISIFYEPVLWLFSAISILIFLRRGEWSFVERFLLAWLALAIVFSLLYAGSGAQHALWLTLPLSALSMYALIAVFSDDRDAIVWIGSDIADGEQRMHYVRIGRLVVALCMLVLLFMFGIHLRNVASAFLTVATPPDGSLFTAISLLIERVMAGQYVLVRIGGVWLMITLLFMFIGYFLGGSLWGNQTTLQGGALGVLVFGLIVGLGNGWRMSVSEASNPAELWHMQATSTDVFLLRRTLLDLAERQTGGFTEIPIVAQAPEDGVIAWVLRDFENARFIAPGQVLDVSGEGIVILPSAGVTPALGGGYLGQNFLISQTWSPAWLQGMDFLPWWAQRRVREGSGISQVSILWLRQDVFNGQRPQP